MCIFPLITTCFGLSQVAFGGDGGGGAVAADAFFCSFSVLLLVFVDLMLSIRLFICIAQLLTIQ